MNRGNHFQLSGNPGAAVAAYREAIAHLGHARSLSADNTLANMEGAAWLNLGHAHLTGGDDAQAEAAFLKSIALLQAQPPSDDVWLTINRAAAWMNLANVRLARRGAPSTAAGACDAAREAVRLISPVERENLSGSEVSLKARRVLCEALGRLIFETAAKGRFGELVDEARCQATAGLRFGSSVRRHSIPDAEDIVARLYFFGGQLLRRHRVHELEDFLREFGCPRNADEPTGRLREITKDILQETLRDFAAPRRLIFGDPASERDLATWQRLRALAEEFARGFPGRPRAS